ncbi:hypothetical protein GOP47_0028167 [Adiantum capillus-veneris]|nr:hypothetical protein GOP47_0028167 [Adiantum capillus-veneris]
MEPRSPTCFARGQPQTVARRAGGGPLGGLSGGCKSMCVRLWTCCGFRDCREGFGLACGASVLQGWGARLSSSSYVVLWRPLARDGWSWSTYNGMIFSFLLSGGVRLDWIWLVAVWC